MMPNMASDLVQSIIDAISCWHVFFVISAFLKQMNIPAKIDPDSAKEDLSLFAGAV